MYKRDPSSPPRILVAPLDWGLGHATRCIPLIRYFLESGCEVWIASEGRVQELLRREFPALTHIPLRGYRIRYATTRLGLVCKIMGQIPGILQTIRYENRWLKETVARHRLDAVVSDNRFGLHHSQIPCVYLTHQLRIKAPIFERLLQKIHYRYIRRYGACWVPDYAGTPNLSGALGHPSRLPPVPVRYLGPLSRFDGKVRGERYPLLFLLSGPEPQRTLFEKQILHQLKGPAVLVRGLPGGGAPLSAPADLVVYDHLPASALEELLSGADWVVARTGYSTVMDLVRLRKKSILVPTPGQTEQEYLGDYLRAQGIAYTLTQATFALGPALEAAATFDYRFPSDESAYREIAAAWLASLG